MVDEIDKLAVLLDDPSIRETIFALGHSGPGGLHAVGSLALARAGGELLAAPGLARLIGAGIALDDAESGAFGA